MLQIQIDGKEVSVEQGATVIEAAQKLGTYIPPLLLPQETLHCRQTAACAWWKWKKRPKPLPGLRHAGNRRHGGAHPFRKKRVRRRKG